MHREDRQLRALLERLGWSNVIGGWLFRTYTGNWNGHEATLTLARSTQRMRLVRPMPCTLHVTGVDALSRFVDAFRADPIEIEGVPFRFHGDDRSAALRLLAEGDVRRQLQAFLHNGCELAIERGHIVVLFGITRDAALVPAAWALIVAAERILQ